MNLLLYLCSKLSHIHHLPFFYAFRQPVSNDKAGVTMQNSFQLPFLSLCVHQCEISTRNTSPGPAAPWAALSLWQPVMLLSCCCAAAHVLIPLMANPSCPARAASVTAAAPSSCRAVPSAAAEPSPLRAYLQSLMIIFNSVLEWMTTSMFQ